MTVLALSAALAACGDAGNAGDDNEGTEAGGVQTEQQSGEQGTSSQRDGRSVSGSETAQEHGTAVNDTTPHRPGSPQTP